MRVAMIANAISNALGGTDGSTAALLPSMSPKELGLAVPPRVVKKAAHKAPQGESSTRSATREEEKATPQRRCGLRSSQMGCLRGFSTAALQWSKWRSSTHSATVADVARAAPRPRKKRNFERCSNSTHVAITQNAGRKTQS